jgi:hypothetical protein
MAVGGLRIPDSNGEQAALVVRGRRSMRSARTMKNRTQILLWWLVIAAVLPAVLSIPSWSHDWYEKRCCSDKDCAPATRVEPLSGGGVYATSEHGTAFCSKEMHRPSADHRYHVCMRPSGFAPACICLYVPGTS